MEGPKEHPQPRVIVEEKSSPDAEKRLVSALHLVLRAAARGEEEARAGSPVGCPDVEEKPNACGDAGSSR